MRKQAAISTRTMTLSPVGGLRIVEVTGSKLLMVFGYVLPFGVGGETSSISLIANVTSEWPLTVGPHSSPRNVTRSPGRSITSTLTGAPSWIDGCPLSYKGRESRSKPLERRRTTRCTDDSKAARERVYGKP
jgi:hypothetical protein